MNTPTIFSQMFNSSGLFIMAYILKIAAGIKRKHYISIKCDGTYDNIISAKIGTELDGGYEIYPKGDNNISFSGDEYSNYLTLAFNNFKWDTLEVAIDDKK